MKKVVLNLGNQQVEAEQMDFTPIEEAWGKYKLNDGTVVKLKVVTSDIFKLPNKDPMTGLPNLIVRSTNIMTVEPPETFTKKEIN